MRSSFPSFRNSALPTDATRWPPEDERSGRFAVDPHGRPTGGFTWVRLADTVDAVLSLTTLAHSLMTVLRQDEPAPSRTAAGFHAAEATYQPIVRNEGARALFTQKNVELAERYGGVQWQIFSPGEAWSPRFEAVARLVRQSQAAGTEVVLAINPLHAEYLVLLDSIGLWPLMQEWKRTLARIGRNEDVPVWDFSLFDDHATENVDDLAPRGQALEWFWEPAHYRRELGDLMLANIFRRHCPPALAQAPPYGVRLDMLSESGFEAFGQAQRQAREAYKAAHPSVVARLERMLRP